MKKPEIFQIYFTLLQKNGKIPSEPFEYLKKKLSEEDYLDAEEIINEAFAVVQENAFYEGCAVLPNLIRELMED